MSVTFLSKRAAQTMDNVPNSWRASETLTGATSRLNTLNQLLCNLYSIGRSKDTAVVDLTSFITPAAKSRVHLNTLRTDYSKITYEIDMAKKFFIKSVEKWDAFVKSKPEHCAPAQSELAKTQRLAHIQQWFVELDKFKAKIFQPSEEKSCEEALHFRNSVLHTLSELQLLHALFRQYDMQ